MSTPIGRAGWPRPVLALIAAGAVARAAFLAADWNSPVDPDVTQYQLLARAYSFAHPYSASFREPLWRALTKIFTGPFGYGPNSARVFTTVVSILTLPLAWLLLRRLVRSRGVPERAAVLALAVLALSAQAAREASQGMREDTCLLLFLVFASLLLARPQGTRNAVLVALTAGVLSVVRWELAVFATAVTLLFALARRVRPLTPVLCALAVVLCSGPWLLANRARHGQLFYNTAVHSTYYWKEEQPAAVQARYHTPPAVDPKIHLTWGTYYLHYLGPARSVERFAAGYPKLAAKLLASQVVPRGAAVGVLGSRQGSSGWLAAMIAVGLAACALVVWAARRLRRGPRLPSLLFELVAILVLAVAPYAVLEGIGLEMRLLLFAVPLLGLAAGTVADVLLRGTSREAAPQADPGPAAPGEPGALRP
jgi:hypothetical protein